ncbi:MAG TPA: peptidase S8 [Bacteroidetes bacterium]|nr:peptidase S8 [Bacteroidota bacterium]HRR07055.1 S8 family serine peptidase [Rhodothermales bacterium]
MMMRLIRPSLFGSFALFFVAVPFLYSQVSLPRISDMVLADVQDDAADVLVLFREMPDLSEVTTLPTKQAMAEMVYARLRLTADQSQQVVKNWLDLHQLPYKAFWVVNALSLTVNREQLEQLAAFPEVQHITSDRAGIHMAKVQMEPISPPAGIEWGISKTRADQVWTLGIKGKGAVVGGLDTGFKWDHPAIKLQYRGWDGVNAAHNYNWFDGVKQNSPLNPSGSNPCGLDLKVPCDDDNHGTHTMGTMVGLDGDNIIGMAPEAKWVACRNMERGWGMPSFYLACFQWMLAPTDVNGQNPDPSKAPHVINNSWYCAPEEGCPSLAELIPFETAVNNLRSSGIMVVVSAGNSGPACGTVQYGPAIFEKSFSVAATNINNEAASFSSRGLVTFDASNRMKPNIAAPGHNVRSSIRGDAYAALSGTSMAGPHVAGMVALMISANPKLAGHVDQIEQIIKETAVPHTTSETCGGVSGTQIPNPVFGYGRIDAFAAVNKALLVASEVEEQPQQFVLTPPYPNPFNPSTRLTLTAEKAERVNVSVFDALGRKVTELFDGVLAAQETKAFLFEAQNLPNGLYFIRATGTTQSHVRLATLLK